MTPEEIAVKLKEQEEEEKAKTTYTREMLELIVSQFALSISKQNVLKIEPDHFRILLEEYQTNSSFMESGNPVIIHIRMQDLADALIKKGRHLYDFKNLIENCLRVVPKLLHTLAVIPTRDLARWDDELRKFKWHQGIDKDFLPKLLPASEIHYDITMRIVATHIPSDTRIVVSDRKFDLVKLKRQARELLSEEFYAPDLEEKDLIENGDVQEN